MVNVFGDKVKFVKCNVDNSLVIFSKYGIKVILIFIFFRKCLVVLISFFFNVDLL